MNRDVINLNAIQNANRALIIKHLQHTGGCSRTALSQSTGLTQATITKIVRSMIETGLIVETGKHAGMRGRHSIDLSLNTGICKVMGLRIFRTYMTSCVCDLAVTQFETRRRDFPDDRSGRAVLTIMEEEVAYYLARYPDLRAIGVAVPGPYLKNEGRLELLADPKLLGAFNIQSELETASQLPVFVEHNTTAGALAYYWMQGLQNSEEIVVHMSSSESVGCGVCIRGAPFSGSHGIAGELGHISIQLDGIPCECGNYGCIEKYCSARSMVMRTTHSLAGRRDSVLAGKDPLSAGDIFAAAEAGDPLAVDKVQELGRYIAQAISTIVLAYDPDVIVLSGEISLGGEILLRAIRGVLEKRLLPSIYGQLKIVLYRDQEDLILLGSAVLAVNEVLSRPKQYLSALPAATGAPY